MRRATEVGMARRNDLTVYQKLDLLRKYDALPSCSQRKAALELHISQPLLCKLLKNRDALLAGARSHQIFTRKRKRIGKDVHVEEALLEWFVVAKREDAPISRRVLADRAERFADELGSSGFRATDGWLTRWMRRHDLDYRKTPGEERRPGEGFGAVPPPEFETFPPDDPTNADRSGESYGHPPEAVFMNVSNECEESKDCISSYLKCSDDMKIFPYRESDDETCPYRSEDSNDRKDGTKATTSSEDAEDAIDIEMIKSENSPDDSKPESRDSEACVRPTFSEAKRALLVLRGALTSYGCISTNDFKDFYRIETLINRIYIDQNENSLI